MVSITSHPRVTLCLVPQRSQVLVLPDSQVLRDTTYAGVTAPGALSTVLQEV